MTTEFQFGQSVEFVPERASEMLRLVPAGPGVLCLQGAGQPYLTRTTDLRRRASRLLAPPEVAPDGQPVLSKRLNLRERVALVAWTEAGSEFEALLVLYHATAAAFGHAEARRRLRLHAPYFVRFTAEQSHPRLYTTNRLSPRGLNQMYGPFASRATAERYVDAVLDLFKLRRCYEDLEPYPEHPGCVYQEMKKCLAPCNLACSPDEYGTESAAVGAFLATRGESMLSKIAQQRTHASEEMDFERAAALHTQWTKIKAATLLPGDLVRPVPLLRAIIVQKSAPEPGDSKNDRLEASLYLLERGYLAGPVRLSTLGVRAVKEQTSVGSSLFAQPLMLQAVPLEAAPGEDLPVNSPEQRAASALAELQASLPPENDSAMVVDHLSLLRRWFYRPEKQRAGEIFFPNEDGSWPTRRILRGAARMALGEPGVMAETQRDGMPAAKVKILHEGRDGVERAVPVVARTDGRRSRKVEMGEISTSPSIAPGAGQ